MVRLHGQDPGGEAGVAGGHHEGEGAEEKYGAASPCLDEDGIFIRETHLFFNICLESIAVNICCIGVSE